MRQLENNPWRALARSMNRPCNREVVVIPDLSNRLLDPGRYGWDSAPFQKWFRNYFAGHSVHPRDLYPEWRFNHQVEPDGTGFTTEGRHSFVCVYAKLKHERLWPEVQTVRWVGPTGEIVFTARRGSEGLRQYLLRNSYGDWWCAGMGYVWGVRSRFRGAQLHFRGLKDGNVNVHIDLNNPGDPLKGPPTGWVKELPDAILHKIGDDWDRASTHLWWMLEAALKASQSILVPDCSTEKELVETAASAVEEAKSLVSAPLP
jgi:hypothetical protein